VYVPVAQMADRHAAFFNRVGARLSWVVRSHDEPYRIANAIQQELRVATGGLPATAIRSMDDVSAASTGRMEFNMWLMTIFGASALLLAAVGISGVVSYTVRQRTREIGIRLALGADSRRIRTMILLQGMTPALIGIAIGTAGAFGLAQSLTALLYGISPHDRVVFLTAPIVLGLVALAAVWLPMRRSALVEPATALRHD
jgi:ABC-type antimicrobial peptide transport system permease subunit